MQRLRQALGDDPETPLYIETIPKRGYRFIGEVTGEEAKEQSVPSTAVVDETVEKVAATLADAAISSSQKSRSLRFWRVLAISVGAIFLAAAVIYWISAPPPLPRVVASRALTKTGFRKGRGTKDMVSDGTAVFFQEARPSRVTVMRVPVGGGEEMPIPVGEWQGLSDISKDGSELLLELLDVKSNQSDAWIQPLPSGAPRLAVKDARNPVWTADARGILFVRHGGELWRANADGTDVHRLAAFNAINHIAVAPDGEHIRLYDFGTKILWETRPDGSNPHEVLRRQALGNWSSDGKYFFFVSRDGLHANLRNLWVKSERQHWWQRGTATRQLTFGPLTIGPPAISKDGKHVYAVGREPHGELSVWDKGKDTFVPYLGGIPACFVDFSRDGQWIAYVSFPEGSLWRSRIDGSEKRQLTVPPMSVVNPRWSPDGKLIAFWDAAAPYWDPTVQSRIYAISADGGGPMLLQTREQRPIDPSWSPDGKSIAYSFDGGSGNSARLGEIWILDLATQNSTKVPGSNGLWSPRWSPDGKYLVALKGNPSRLWLFSFASQQWSDLVGLDPGWPNWSPDIKSVYFAYGETSRGETAMARIWVSDHKIEQIAPLAGFAGTSTIYGFWLGLTPDGRPITTRDTGIEEVYAFDLEYK